MQRKMVKGKPMMIEIERSAPSCDGLLTSAMATRPSVQHQKHFCQTGICDALSPEAEMMSSVIEPESEEV